VKGTKLWETQIGQSKYGFCEGKRGFLSGWGIADYETGDTLFDLISYYQKDNAVGKDIAYVDELSENVNFMTTSSYFFRGVDIEFPEKGVLRISQDDYQVDTVAIPFSYGRKVSDDSFIAVDPINISLYKAGGRDCLWSEDWREILGEENRIADVGANSQFVAVASRNGHLKILSIEDARILSCFELNCERVKLIVIGDKILVTGVNGITNKLVCVSTEDLKVSWVKENFGGPFAVKKGIVFTVEGTMQPVGLSLEDGEILWKSKRKLSTNYVVANDNYVVYSYILTSMQIYDIQDI